MNFKHYILRLKEILDPFSVGGNQFEAVRRFMHVRVVAAAILSLKERGQCELLLPYKAMQSLTS